MTPWTEQSWNSPAQNTEVGSLSLLQGIFLTQESNWGLLHCRWILSRLSYQGSPSVVCICLHFGDSGLPCDLISLLCLRRIVDFTFCSVFSYWDRVATSRLLTWPTGNWKWYCFLKNLRYGYHFFLLLTFPCDCSKSSVQLLSCVGLFVTSWTAACQASLSITRELSGVTQRIYILLQLHKYTYSYQTKMKCLRTKLKDYSYSNRDAVVLVK